MNTSLPKTLSEVRVDEGQLQTVLEDFSTRGFTGTVYAEIGLSPLEDGSFIPVIAFSSHEHINTDQPGAQPDTNRRKPVQSVLAPLLPRLVIKPAAAVLEFNFKQGQLSPTVKVKT